MTDRKQKSRVTQQNNLAATVFVFRLKETGQICCEYMDRARLMEDDPEWEHVDTLEPRRWIEVHYAEVQQ